MKLTEILFLNDVIQKHKSTGAKVNMIMVRQHRQFFYSIFCIMFDVLQMSSFYLYVVVCSLSCHIMSYIYE